jgi:hypothetical protein
MEISVGSQAAALAEGLLLGAFLGIVYDFLRAWRHRLDSGPAGGAADVFFGMAAGASVFLYAMYRGGSLRVSFIACPVLGGALYFLTVSPFFLSVFGLIADGLLIPLRALAGLFKKSAVFVKKNFDSLKKWYKIKRHRIIGSFGNDSILGGRYEKQKSRGDTPQNHTGRNSNIRSGFSYIPAGQDIGGRAPAGAAAGAGRASEN